MNKDDFYCCDHDYSTPSDKKMPLDFFILIQTMTFYKT